MATLFPPEYGVVLMRHFPLNLLSQILLLSPSAAPKLFLLFGSCSVENVHVFVVSITVCADFDLLPQNWRQSTLVYCLCPRAFCLSFNLKFTQSVSASVCPSVCQSVSLALSVSHCVNTLITAGKRCATHTHTHIAYICC